MSLTTHTRLISDTEVESGQFGVDARQGVFDLGPFGTLAKANLEDGDDYPPDTSFHITPTPTVHYDKKAQTRLATVTAIKYVSMPS